MSNYDEALLELLVAAEAVTSILFVGKDVGVGETQRLINALYSFQRLPELAKLSKRRREQTMAELYEWIDSLKAGVRG